MVDRVTISRQPFFLAAGGLAIVVIFGFVGIRLLVGSTSVFPDFLIGLAVLLFAASPIPLLARLLDSRPVVEIDDAGILVRDVSESVIPWSSISEARLWKNKTGWQISLWLDRETYRAIRPRLISRSFLAPTRVTFLASQLDRNAPDVMALIMDRRSRTAARG